MIKKNNLYIVVAIMLVVYPLLLMGADNKDSSAIYFRQALALKQQVNPAEASQLFEKAILYDPGNALVRVEYAAFLVDHRKIYEGLSQLNQVLKTEPKHPQALAKITEISFMLRRWKDVISYGNMVPDADRFQYMLGKAYYEVENYSMAKTMLLGAVKQDPTNLAAYTTLGKVFIELDEYYNAANAYKEAYALDSTDPYLVYEYGLLYYTLNDEREAVKYFELAVKRGYTPDLDYNENLGLAYLSFDIEKGVAILNQVLVNKPNNRSILMEIAHARFKRKQYDLAATVFLRAYQADASNYHALYMLGMSTIREGNKAKGNELCEKAITLDPTLQGLRRLSFMN